jgi:channel protein (hemolysin III family)
MVPVARMGSSMKRSASEERANTITHMMWFLASIVMLVIAGLHESLGLALHSLGGMLASIGSTLYHHHDSEDASGKAMLRRADKTCIFLFMGMTALGFGITQGGVWLGYASVVMLASIATAFAYHSGTIREESSEGFYMALAVGAILSASHLLCPFHAIAGVAINLLLGLACYGIGYYCYSKDAKLRWMHTFWHVFVLMAWTFHALAIVSLS